MLNEKINLTPELKNFIIKTRNEKGKKLIDLEEKSKFSHKAAWFSQIEGKRTKTIKRDDIIDIFKIILDISEEEAEKYIKDFLQAKIQETSKQLSFFDVTGEDGEAERIKQEFDEQIGDINEGFIFLYNNISNKKDALEIVKRISMNMHSKDMGFTLSAFTLPWLKLSNMSEEAKTNFLKSIFKMINEQGNNKKED